MCAVQIRGTDSLQLRVGGKGYVGALVILCVQVCKSACVCVCMCMCLMSDVVRYLNYANERSAENDWGISC